MMCCSGGFPAYTLQMSPHKKYNQQSYRIMEGWNITNNPTGSWKVGMATGQSGKNFVAVANYWPAGNIQSWFVDNVLRK